MLSPVPEAQEPGSSWGGLCASVSRGAVTASQACRPRGRDRAGGPASKLTVVLVGAKLRFLALELLVQPPHPSPERGEATANIAASSITQSRKGVPALLLLCSAYQPHRPTPVRVAEGCARLEYQLEVTGATSQVAPPARKPFSFLH